ncbi:MAG: C-GCAxxG-C-C family protein [Christensenellaceae bacterium]|jgi:C_GCAxxG_C_C family probable redox protein
MDYEQKAKELFENGYNCAQAVIGAFAEPLGASFSQMMALSAPFGGGLGKRREVCGAVSGMLMAYGLYSGGYEIGNDEDKAALYEKTRTLLEKFEETFGSIVCKTLLELNTPEQNMAPEKRTPAYYEKRPCADFVAGAARILAEEMK